MKTAIIFGGSSFEHEISIVSAITLKKVLSDDELIFIFLSAEREVYLIEAKNMKASYFSSSEYKKAKKVSLQNAKFVIPSSGLFAKSQDIDIDVALNLIHGRDGEDGKIASLLEFYSIPYIGPRIDASVLSYSKSLTKCFAQSVGVETLDYKILRIDDKREAAFEYPFIVKPSHLGSSIGVSVVKSDDEFDYALDVAFEFDDEVIIEPFIEGIKEFNIAGCYTGAWELSIVEEPQKDEMLDFEKKYLDFSRDERASEAVIDNSLKLQLENAFKKIYKPMFEGAVIRCDFFYHNDKIYLNEINPIPGSMANYLFDDFTAMIKRLAQNLPKEREIKIDYKYINDIRSAKGKA